MFILCLKLGVYNIVNKYEFKTKQYFLYYVLNSEYII